MQSLIAKALRTDLNISVQISVKAVSYKFKCWHLMYNLQRQVKGIAVWIISFHSINGLNLHSCVGRVEPYQVPRHPNVSRNHEQQPGVGDASESTDFIQRITFWVSRTEFQYFYRLWWWTYYIIWSIKYRSWIWQTCDHEIDFCGVELLSALCQQVRDFRSMVYSYSAWNEFQLFLGANSILYGKY